jgi:hypothetical protein
LYCEDLTASSDAIVSWIFFGSALVKGVKVDSMWKFDVCAQFYKLVQRVNMFVCLEMFVVGHSIVGLVLECVYLCNKHSL